MFAFDPPAISQAAPASNQPDVIEVVGTRTDQALKIDRRTYQVQQTPHSLQKDTFQLLRGLPAVTISADDQINLLGSGNVKILIDGHDTRTDLHTLHGSDIDRIEIITNPSAQYSAEGTGGIINIVLRKKRAEGLSGNASVEGSSLGHANGNGSVKYKKGKWTYEGTVFADGGSFRRSTYHKVRSVEAFRGGRATSNSETGGGPQHIDAGFVQAKLTYDLDSRTSLSAEAGGGAFEQGATNRSDFRALTPDFQSFSQLQRSNSIGTFLEGKVAFDHKGLREGETLSATILGNGLVSGRNTVSALLSNGGALDTEIHDDPFWGEAKVDWAHPIGTRQILSIGAIWDLQAVRHHYRFTGSGVAFGGEAVDSYRGRISTLSAYTTFQQKIGTWAIMPGVRIEQNSRNSSSPGRADFSRKQADVFPTVHIEHPIGKTLDLTLSYSKRIDRAQIDVLRPYQVVRDVLSVSQGNPDLRDQSTDAFEANLHYHRGKLDAGLIVYDRETKRLWNQSYFVNSAGQNVVTTVNVGHRSDRGAEFDVNTPVLSRVKLTASINLFDSRVPIDAVSSRAMEEQFRFTSNSTLEWDGPDRGKKPGDIAQLTWHYESPATQFQYRDFAWHRLTLSYTHSFNRTLSLSATADSGLLHHGHRLVAPLVQEYYAEHNRAEFKLKLMKTFGNPK